MPSPRLFLDADLAADARVTLTAEQAHYLVTVLRMAAGAEVRAFNGRDGEWRTTLTDASRKAGTLHVHELLRAQSHPPDLHLLFAPVKKTRTDFIVEKATELGVRALRPVFTRRTTSERVNTARLAALAREAAEQTERLEAPEVRAPEKLDRLLDQWAGREQGRALLFCDESAGENTPWALEAAKAPPALTALFAAPDVATGPWAILIGPEGGFAPEERQRLRAAHYVFPVTLGPRILRADTAAVAALTLWQAVLGDWGDG